MFRTFRNIRFIAVLIQGQEQDEIRLAQTYFCDRNKGKLPKQKLQVTASVMLPLRRLLLLGCEDGLVRVIS